MTMPFDVNERDREDDLLLEDLPDDGGYEAQTVDAPSEVLPGEVPASSPVVGTPPPMPAPMEGPTMAPPPPPPVPPAPATDLGVGDIGDYAAEWLANPNRYLSDLGQATRAESEARLAHTRGEAERGMAERLAGRGLIGSSLEEEAQTELDEALYRAAAEDERELLEMLTTAETLDRRTAAEIAMDAAQLGESTGLDRYGAALEGWRAAAEQGRFEGTLGISQQQIDLRAEEIIENARQFNRSISFEEAQREAERELTREQGSAERELTREIERGRLGLSQQEIDLRAQQLQQEAELGGRALDIEEARDQARVALEREALQQQLELHNQDLSQREAEFARQFGLDERQFAEQQSQFQQQMAEQVAQRLQEDEHFRTALDREDARYALDVGLRERALELQREGMEMEDAFNRAALEQEGRLTERAQALQEEGMERDDAYRYAALEQDAEFTRRAQDLQERGLDIDEAYQQADLEWRREQFFAELEFREGQAETEQERFEMMMELWDRYFGQGGGPTILDPGLWNPDNSGGDEPTIDRGEDDGEYLDPLDRIEPTRRIDSVDIDRDDRAFDWMSTQAEPEGANAMEWFESLSPEEQRRLAQQFV